MTVSSPLFSKLSSSQALHVVSFSTDHGNMSSSSPSSSSSSSLTSSTPLSTSLTLQTSSPTLPASIEAAAAAAVNQGQQHQEALSSNPNSSSNHLVIEAEFSPQGLGIETFDSSNLSILSPSISSASFDLPHHEHFEDDDNDNDDDNNNKDNVVAHMNDPSSSNFVCFSKSYMDLPTLTSFATFCCTNPRCSGKH